MGVPTRTYMRTYLALFAAILPACASVDTTDDGSADEQDLSTSYVLIQDFAKIDQGAWYDLRAKLNKNFDDICGDTFCEGDFANITPLTFGCTVTSKAGNVKDCVWTFGASTAEVDPKTAAIFTNAPTFQCHITAAHTTAVKLVAALGAVDDALAAPLPGGSPSIYDQLGDCFEHPIGATDIVLTKAPQTYVPASSYYTSTAGWLKWRGATDALKLAFDNICGDTFCGSDFGDLQAMQFECAVTKSTGNVKSCKWVFAGSYDVVGAHGATAATSQAWSCPVAVGAGTSLSALITALTAPGTEDAIHRPLPGLTTSAYDAIAGCLP